MRYVVTADELETVTEFTNRTLARKFYMHLVKLGLTVNMRRTENDSESNCNR